MGRSGGRAFQTRGTACAKALGWEHGVFAELPGGHCGWGGGRPVWLGREVGD